MAIFDNTKRQLKFSIRTYLILMNLILFGILLPSLSFFFWGEANQLKQDALDHSIATMQASLKTRGTSLLSNMGLSANQAISSFDFTLLNTLVSQVTDSDKELRYCLLMNETGIAVAHSNQSLVGEQMSGDIYQQVIALHKEFPPTINESTIIPVAYMQQHRGKGLLQAVTPVYNGSQMWGSLRCAYSLDNLERQISLTEAQWQLDKNNFTRVFLFIASATLILGIVISFYFTRRFERAVGKLNKGVEAVAGGNFEYYIPPKGLLCSEFDTLSISINQMTHKLYASHKQLDEYSNSLEAKVEERTEELKLANNELEATNKELETFSYSVSHDLRAPLRSIDGFSKILIEDHSDELGDQALDCLRRVRKGTLRMGDLIDSLLSLSRLNREPLNYRTVDLTTVANDIVEQLQVGDPERTVRVTIASNMNVEADINLLNSVMENLIGNAWKYSAKNPDAAIEIGMKDKKTFFVKDNGAGFDMRRADKLFGAFQRLHLDSEFEGTGVGLATVLRIIHRHGGKVWAEAEPGKGATFYFTLS